MTAKAKVTQIKKFTLADLKPKPYKLKLEVPGHPDVDMWVEIVGVESKAYALAAANIYKNRGGLGDKDVTIEQQIDESAELVSNLVTNWGPEDVFGQPYSPEAALELLKDFDYKWIKQQIEDAAGEREHFFSS